MRTLLALLVISLPLLATSGPAVAQSSPFAGAWSGSISSHQSTSCTGHNTCDFALPWAGTIDAQGDLMWTFGATSITCSDGTTHSFGASTTPILAGRVSAAGTLAFPAAQTCAAGSMQFSLSPAIVTGSQSCTAITDTCVSVQVSYTGGRTAAAPFPMTVTSNITATTANASAQLQPRPEDAGKAESVFVFAHAPASRVQGAKRAQRPSTGPIRLQDGGDPCVLAQVDPTGKLVPASASSMGPAFSGVLGAQGQSVTLLNNVPTPGVAGATIFAGYGPDSQSMLAAGNYQGAVSVPGTVSCGTTLSTAAAPDSPAALSGLWYNAAESGWGVYFAQRRNILFAAWYTYDTAGKPKWYVSSSCAMPADVIGTSGTCNGALFEVGGARFFGAPFDASRVHPANAGTLQVAFTDANHASMTYSVAGQTRTVPITRQVFQASPIPPAVDFTDLWYNASESGWGMAMSHQFGIIFLAWFVYDASGGPVWYVASNCTVSGNGCTGALFRTTGPAFGPTFDPAAVHAFQVGTVTVGFSDPNHALLTYTVDGVTASKIMTRETF